MLYVSRIALSALVFATSLSQISQAQTVEWFDNGPGKINYNPSKPAHQPSAVVLPGTPNKIYSIWAEDSGSLLYQIRVAVHNPESATPWVFVDRKLNGVARAANQGINKVTSKSGSLPRLAVVSGNLFATWIEDGKIRAAAYNGNDAASNWTLIDGNSTGGLNFNSGKLVRDPDLASFNGKLYAAWHEQSGSGKAVYWQIRVRCFNLTTMAWGWADGGGANGINYSATKNAQYVRLSVLPSNGKLYAAWHESNGTVNKIRVKSYNGTSWSAADGGGLNYNNSQNAAFPYLFAFNSKMYAFWEEANQIRVRSYDGLNDAAPSWNLVDGGGANGINKDPSHYAYYITASEVNGKMFVGFNELNSSDIEELEVKSFNGDDAAPVWSSENNGVVLLQGSQRPQCLNLDNELHIIVDGGFWPDFGIHAFIRQETPIEPPPGP
jgi:hypothetical protein